MTGFDVLLQGVGFLLAVVAVLILVKVLFIGWAPQRRPREDGTLQEHQARSAAATGRRF